MKDYKLSEIKAICEKMREEHNDCLWLEEENNSIYLRYCEMFGACNYSFSIRPRNWEIDKEANDDTQ